MAGGQAIDLAAEGRTLDLAELEDMHIHKTGALIRAGVLLGAYSSPAVDEALLAKLDHYAKCIGLAFQIRDDILDVEGETGTLGKTQGADAARAKPTYPAILGLEPAKARARELFAETMDTLASLDERADPLRWIASYTVERNH
jgi:farnesyl diphosphate synthase